MIALEVASTSFSAGRHCSGSPCCSAAVMKLMDSDCGENELLAVVELGGLMTDLPQTLEMRDSREVHAWKLRGFC